MENQEILSGQRAVEYLIAGSADIDRMRKEIKQFTSSVFSVIEFNDLWPIFKNHQNVKSAPLVQFKHKGFYWTVLYEPRERLQVRLRYEGTEHSFPLTSVQKEYVANIYEGLPIFWEQMVELFPHIPVQLHPILDAGMQHTLATEQITPLKHYQGLRGDMALRYLIAGSAEIDLMREQIKQFTSAVLSVIHLEHLEPIIKKLSLQHIELVRFEYEDLEWTVFCFRPRNSLYIRVKPKGSSYDFKPCDSEAKYFRTVHRCLPVFWEKIVERFPHIPTALRPILDAGKITLGD